MARRRSRPALSQPPCSAKPQLEPILLPPSALDLLVARFQLSHPPWDQGIKTEGTGRNQKWRVLRASLLPRVVDLHRLLFLSALTLVPLKTHVIFVCNLDH